MRYFKFSFLLPIVVALVLGLAVPASAQEDTGALCVRVYADRNANGFFDSGERLVEGAVVKLSSPTLDHPATYTTGVADRPECVDALPPDLYTVLVKPSEGATATTPTELQIQVNAGEKVTVEVGTGMVADASAETAAICASIYNDVNGDGLRGEGEELIRNGEFTLLALDTGTTLGPNISTGRESYCFEGLTEGNYHVIATAPSNYAPTSRFDWGLMLPAESTADLEFGAQSIFAGTTEQEERHDDPEFWLSVAAVIGLAITPFLTIASLILNIVVLRRLGRMQAEKPKASASEAP